MNLRKNIIGVFCAMLTFGLGVAVTQSYIPAQIDDSEVRVVNEITTQHNSVCYPQLQQQRQDRFTVAGVKTDEEVERFWTTFQKAVAENDRNKVTSMATYPLRVNYYFDPLKKNYRFVKNRAEFIKIYDKIFDDALKNLIAKTSIDDIGARYDGIATPRGEIWIGVICLDRKCDGDYKIQVRTIHANSVFIERPNQRE